MDERIQILDSVYKELRVVLSSSKAKLYQNLTVTETTFFDDFQKILGMVFSKDYEDVTEDLNEEELTYYYSIVKNFVDLVSERVETKAKGLMDAWLIKTGRTHEIHYIWPTESKRITSYMSKEGHTLGIDIGGVTSGQKGPVCAVIGGTLTVAADVWSGSPSYSSYVIISGDDGREYRYVHMEIYEHIKKKLNVVDEEDNVKEVDKRVEAGTPLGMMSNIGKYKVNGKWEQVGVHLHLEIIEGGKWLNPLDFFPNIAVTDDGNLCHTNVAGPERALIYQAPEATQGTDPVKWDYQKDGRFQAKSGAMLNQLTQYVEHKGLTWADAAYDGDLNRKIDPLNLKAGEVVCFPSEKISVAEIEAKLAELGHDVQQKSMPETAIESVSDATEVNQTTPLGTWAYGTWTHGNDNANVTAHVGHTTVEGNIDFSAFGIGNEYTKEDDASPYAWGEDNDISFGSVEVSGALSASGAKVEGEASIGDSMLGMGVEGEAILGNASLKGKVHVGVNDKGQYNANVGGEAIVLAVSGEVKGTISIFGIEITAVVSGYAGGVGIEGKIGIEDSKFVAKVGAILGLGGSVGLEVGFSDD